MMAEKSDQDGVMNLSTSKDDENENMANGEIYKNGKLEENSQGTLPLSPPSKSNTTTSLGAAKRKIKSNSMVELANAVSTTSPVASAATQPLMMMAAQHGLTHQQMQQFLQQQSQSVSPQQLSPQQLQQMMQHQSMMLQHQRMPE
ncbi:hypothetical protein KUTeg_021330 [Tegillarca granosa]|uniref:Uncharacterized protein n=1 Tax=Tegillarca granosa TaxID=220873 RepID=A0ABQ9EAG2_TEGGR|nr:hypothetical protein KUTeg_021330 [Tegillarca granosa]